jgi:site-specific DNA recombinase
MTQKLFLTLKITNLMKSLIIARVSTEEQREAGNSLPAQLERMKSYCKRNSFDVAQVFSFDESAYKEKREDFDNNVITKIDELHKKEKVAVCFDKVDRLSRNVFDKRVAYLYQLALEGKIELHFVSDNQVISDKLSATEKSGFSMSLVMASYYSNAISDNVKRAFEQKRRNGEWTGPVRLGYLNVPRNEDDRTRKTIIIDPDRGHLITEMFDKYATGNYSLETIRKEMTAKGLKSKAGYELSKSVVENILKDSFYCGIAMSKKYGPYAHIYPKLIDRETFNKCKEVRESRKKKPNKEKSKDFILKGILTCSNCGCGITAEQVKKPNGNTYNYYSCTNGKGICKRVYVSEKALLEPVYAILERLEGISQEAQDRLIKELRNQNEAQVEYHNKQIVRIQSEYNTFQKRKNSLIDMFADQSITKLDYDKKMQEYNDKMQLLEIELSEYGNADKEYKIVISTVFSLARRAKSIFNSSEVHEKRQILNYLLQNSTLNEKTPCFTMRSPYNLILGLASSPDWLSTWDDVRMAIIEENSVN